MEDNIQTIITIIISAFLLFIFPVYMAYEKKDDISYSLAVRYTQDLVDTIRNKGYLSLDMYEQYKKNLLKTGNRYDVTLTHEYNRYDPITKYYTRDASGRNVLLKTSTQKERKEYEEQLTIEAIERGYDTDVGIQAYIKSVYDSENIYKIEDTYEASTEVYKENYIESILYGENKLLLYSDSNNITCSDISGNQCVNAYIMNEGDNFNITIKNNNVTIATVIYNMVTANTLDSNTRIYVNYGGQILSTKWYGKVDYNKMKHDTVGTTSTSSVLFEHVNELPQDSYINITKTSSKDYTILFDAFPSATTELREKGKLESTEGYNFIMGKTTTNTGIDYLFISVGINGISLLTENTTSRTATTTTSLSLPYYDKKVIKTRYIDQEYTYIQNGRVVRGTRKVPEEYETTERTQRTISEYSKIEATYVSNGKILIKLTGKSGVGNFQGYVTCNDPHNLLKGLNYVKTNPANGEYNISIPGVDSAKITINGNSIYISANTYFVKRNTILSYPTPIEDYISVRITISKNEAEKYVATLFIDNEKLAYSIEMDSIPIVTMLGRSSFFPDSSIINYKGLVKNVKIFN